MSTIDLLAKDPNANADNGPHPASDAEKDDTAMALHLKGREADLRLGYDLAPSEAACGGSVTLVACLLAKGASINACDGAPQKRNFKWQHSYGPASQGRRCRSAVAVHRRVLAVIACLAQRHLLLTARPRQSQAKLDAYKGSKGGHRENLLATCYATELYLEPLRQKVH